MNPTNQTLGIRNPSLSLYAFHLRKSIAPNTPQGVEDDAEHLWQKLQEIGQKLQIPELASLQSKLISYENGTYKPAAEDEKGGNFVDLLNPGTSPHLSEVTLTNGLQLKSVISAFLVDDTYAAELNLYCEESADVSQLSGLNPAGCLLPSQIQASFGQTLLLLAQPADSASDWQKLADACVAALLKDAPAPPAPNLIAKGKLFGSPIFEYDTGELDPIKRCHILVWLDSCETRTRAGEASGLLRLLLCFRHKILYSYWVSRASNQKARRLYAELEKQVNDSIARKSRPDARAI